MRRGRFVIKDPPPEENSLRYLLSTTFPNGMTEKLISVVLDEILTEMKYAHIKYGPHRHIDSALIGVYVNEYPSKSGIVLCHNRNLALPALNKKEEKEEAIQQDFRSLGLLVMEMAYGSLPENPEAIIDNLVLILTQKSEGSIRDMGAMPGNLQLLLNNESINSPAAGERTFSCGLLQTALKLLDREPTSITKLRQTPFIMEHKNLAYFCRKLRKARA